MSVEAAHLASPAAAAGEVRSAILRTEAEVEGAARALAELGLPRHSWYRAKNWDLWLAVEFITAHVARTGSILDAGASISPILQDLERLGYRRLYACDLWRSRRETLRRLVGRSRIRFSIQDLTATTYPDAAFDAVTCVSVIEHGVDLDVFCREMSRLLRRGGHLIVSTDYWCEPIDTGDVIGWGRPWRIFDETGLCKLVVSAAAAGLVLDGELDTRCGEPVVRWQNRSYTFAYLVLRRV